MLPSLCTRTAAGAAAQCLEAQPPIRPTRPREDALVHGKMTPTQWQAGRQGETGWETPPIRVHATALALDGSSTHQPVPVYTDETTTPLPHLLKLLYATDPTARFRRPNPTAPFPSPPTSRPSPHPPHWRGPQTHAIQRPGVAPVPLRRPQLRCLL